MKGLSRLYTGPPHVAALTNVDLAVEKGEYLAIVGASGSGKSTLLNLIGLLDRPSAGLYELDGQEVVSLTEAERARIRACRVGFVFQSFHLMPHRTALENVMVGQIYRKVPRSRAKEQASEALERVGLAGRRNALPSTLSGGESQRVAIARALVNRPALLLCDEPTGNLDSANSARIFELLADLQATSDVTLIVVTHAMEIASRAHRVITMADGQALDLRESFAQRDFGESVGG
jgi:putative ABC transport system ATP-binding protein